jgi:hypothetical protein
LPTRVEPLPRQDDRAPMLSPSPTVPEPESVALHSLMRRLTALFRPWSRPCPILLARSPPRSRPQ